MEREEFEKKVDTEILPLLKECLMKAFNDGYNQINLESYLAEHNISKWDVIDFGLPSGTKWIIRKSSRSFLDGKNLGLQYPTKEQIEELMRCQWEEYHYDGYHGRVIGRNGVVAGVYDSYHSTLCLWTNESKEDENYMVDAYICDFKDKAMRFEKTKVYSGNKYSTLYVLPSHLK